MQGAEGISMTTEQQRLAAEAYTAALQALNKVQPSSGIPPDPALQVYPLDSPQIIVHHAELAIHSLCMLLQVQVHLICKLWLPL